MKIAIEGCAHGELEKIYDTIEYLEKKDNVKVDLLICCGDFQSTRNMDDLMCMAIPVKYQDICTFYKYYSGEKVAPILTLFIGGNHEASNYLQELAYGGWVAPNIYYMGYANVVNFGGIRIAGVSGIYKGHDYMKGHFEKPPYSSDTLRSAYHVRNLEIFRLKQLQQPIDIILSHDWPRGVYNHGNVQELLKSKPFFRGDIEANVLGSKPCEELLYHLKPSYWFAAHLHCKFAALVAHDSVEGDEGKLTKFLALDKCLPKRQFLQVLDIPHDNSKPLELEYDLEWLTILHFTNHLLSINKCSQYMPGPSNNSRWIFTPTKDEMEMIHQRFNNNLRIPTNFAQTATSYDPNMSQTRANQPQPCLNPQTMVFCDQLGIDDPMALLLGTSNSSMSLSSTSDSLPSFLTPEKPGDLTGVSFLSSQDSPFSSQNNRRTTKLDPPLAFPPKRINMTLPSPKNESFRSTDTLMESTIDGFSPLSKSSFVDTALPSPISRSSQDNTEDSVVLSRGLVLPSPKNSSSTQQIDVDLKDAGTIHSTIEDQLSNNDIGRSGNNLQTLSEVHIEDSNIKTNIDPQPQVKKFKRRNQALYASTEDD